MRNHHSETLFLWSLGHFDAFLIELLHKLKYFNNLSVSELRTYLFSDYFCLKSLFLLELPHS